MEAHPRPPSVELIPSTDHFQDGNSRDHQALPSTRGVGHLARFRGRLLSHANKSKVAQISRIPCQQSNFSVHCSSFWPVDGSIGVHKGRQVSQTDGTGKGYSHPPDDWLLRAPCPERCQLHTQTLLDLCRNLGWVVNLSKSELIPQQVSNFVGYRFDLSQGLVKPTQERWIALSKIINRLLGQETCLVRQFMSLIGLLTAQRNR